MPDINSQEGTKINSIAQWIISLAISIVSCACLFVLLAFYITDQHIMLSTITMRMDILQQRQDRMLNEVETLRRKVAPPVLQPAQNSVGGSPAAATTSQSSQDAAPSSKENVPETSEAKAPVIKDPDLKTPVGK